MTDNPSNSNTLLSVLAHPDDETFGMGGTLALYARQGVAVHLICATRGEVGDVDESYLRGYRSIAERREAELRCAAEKLQLAGVHFLDYRDSGMPGSPDNTHPQALFAAPLEEVAAKIAGYIRKLRPQVVITFDPIGGYKHPDHIAVHNATVRAFDLAGQPDFEDGNPPYQPQRLYYQVIPKSFLGITVRVMELLGRDPRHFGRNHDVNLEALVKEGNFPIHAVINYSAVAQIKDDASLCHASQLGGMSLRRGPMRWAQVLFGKKEYYMRAYPPPQNGRREKDLFNGAR
jgi:LmbE family N-acetylglucosaminyl deacetylase